MNTFGIYRATEYDSAQEAADSGAMYHIGELLLDEPLEDANNAICLVLETLRAAGLCVNHDANTFALAIQLEGVWHREEERP